MSVSLQRCPAKVLRLFSKASQPSTLLKTKMRFTKACFSYEMVTGGNYILNL